MLSIPATKSVILKFASNQDRDFKYLKKPDRPQDGYGAINYDFYRPMVKTADAHLQETIQAFLNPGDAILELGCNSGNNLIPLANKGYRMYGVDLETTLLQELKDTARQSNLSHAIEVEPWDFAENGDVPWPQMKQQFKAIYAVHVLSHLSPSALERTIQRLTQDFLAPGGIIVVSVTKSPSAVQPTYKLTDLNQGYVQYSESTLQKAFGHLSPVSRFTRPFHEGEQKRWQLPNEYLEWRVYQKPA